MKYGLYGTSALIGVAVAVTPAMAGSVGSRDTYAISLSGRFDYGVMFYSQDRSTNLGRGYGFTVDESEIYVNASTTADNGVTYGITIEINAAGDDDNVADEAYAFVENQDVWGRIELGDNDSASDRTAVNAYDILAGRGAWDSSESGDALNAGASFITSDVSIASDDTKLIYFTPRFAGFQLGASLTPETGVNGRIGNDTDNDGDTNSLVSVGANYEGNLGDVGILVGATYETGNRPNNGVQNGSVATEDPEIWSVGAQVTIAGFDLGINYVDFENTNRTKAQTAAGADGGWYYSAGAAYRFGDWKTSLGYYHSERANNATSSTDSDFYSLGVTYYMVPGWRIEMDANYITIDNWNGATVPNQDNDATQLYIVNRFDF